MITLVPYRIGFLGFLPFFYLLATGVGIVLRAFYLLSRRLARGPIKASLLSSLEVELITLILTALRLRPFIVVELLIRGVSVITTSLIAL